MINRFQRTLFVYLLAALPPAAFAYSDGPVPGRTGAAIDGGQNCTACHFTNRPANVDPRGSLRIEAGPYVPGVKQTIRVLLSHPEARRWGFQLTARLASDETKPAGKFSFTAPLKITCGGGAPEGDCGSNVEFVEHTRATTFPGQAGGAVWTLEWTPPAAEAGEVVFYAAGNAANNNNNNQGDFIYTTSTRIAAQAPCALAAAPTITAILNGAAFRNTGFALNTMISIGGTGFQAPGASKTAAALDIVENRFPAQLSCVAVEIDGKAAPVAYVDATQINAQIPTTTALGDVAARVIVNPGTANEKRSGAFTIKLENSAPAFFRFLPSTAVAAVFATTGAPASDPAAAPGAVRPKIGDLISLFATGLGVSEPVYQAGEVVPLTATPRARDQVQVEWNGTVVPAADILYAGLTPGSITGLWQINLRVPATATPGVDNSVVLRTAGMSSPAGVVLPVGR